jgi:hypothetical protein
MTEYAILLTGDETAWAAATDDERAATMARHDEFGKLLAERGHRITGGAELTPSSTTKVVRSTAGGFRVSDGPYAETAEQIGGFYVVESDDLNDLLQVVGVLAETEGVIEVRACVDQSGG